MSAHAPGRAAPVRRPDLRHLVVLVTVLVALAVAGTAMAPPATAVVEGRSPLTGPHPSFESTMLALLNDERTSRGLEPLRRVAGVDNVAREWSDRMAREQYLRHRPRLADPFVGGWRRIGENVGVGYRPASLHQAFMDSRGHRENVLGDFDHVGVGVAISGRQVWITFNFVKGDPTTAARYRANPLTGGYATGAGGSGTFRDIDGNVHEPSIAALDGRGVLVSCATARYCPQDGLRRSEMAVLLARALDLPPSRERFRDVSSDHPYAAEIGALAAAGITRGCNPPANDRFCPEEYVSRQQMATFLTTAYGLRPAPERFRDVAADNVHRPNIGALARAGITRGCNPPANDRYCAGDPVTRAQMATFVKRAMNR